MNFSFFTPVLLLFFPLNQTTYSLRFKFELLLQRIGEKQDVFRVKWQQWMHSDPTNCTLQRKCLNCSVDVANTNMVEIRFSIATMPFSPKWNINPNILSTTNERTFSLWPYKNQTKTVLTHFNTRHAHCTTWMFACLIVVGSCT